MDIDPFSYMTSFENETDATCKCLLIFNQDLSDNFVLLLIVDEKRS